VDDQTPKDPFEDDVKYDKDAAEEAARRMHARGTGGGDDPDPEGGHDQKSLEDAAERIRAGSEPKKNEPKKK
jgi:hypothetical protein